MSIYQKRDRSLNYRKIYEQHHGPIPREDNGRTYEIHHIDGNPNNNCPTNLIAVTLSHHFNIHYSQGDFKACYLMAYRLSLDKTTINMLRKKIGDKKRDKTIHELVNVDGSKFIGTREEFQKKYPNVHGGNLSKIINKKLPSTQGWRLSGEPVPVRYVPPTDLTVYDFVNKDGRTFTGNRNDLLNSEPEFLMGTRGSDSIAISKLVNNKGGVKSVKGWRLSYSQQSQLPIVTRSMASATV